jgi:copper(I)-binding protein
MRKLLFVVALGTVGGTLIAQAKPSLVTVDAWMAPTSAENAPVYLRVVSHQSKLDKLLGASTPVAEVTALMTAGDNPTHLVSIDVPPGETVALGPHGAHLVLMDIDAPLLPGDTFPLTVAFRRAGNIETDVTVSDRGAPSRRLTAAPAEKPASRR